MPEGERLRQRDLPYSSSSDTSTPAETTPLIPPAPTTSGKHTASDSTNHATPDGAAIAKVDAEDDTIASQALSPTRGLLVTLALGVLIFIDATNMSLLTTTQSAIASELDAFEATSWFTSAFLITMSALGPLNGKLSSLFSPRSCISISALLLALGCLMCAISTDFETFVIGRCVQGVGASGIFTISIIIVLELTGSKRRGLGIGMLNTGFTIGVAVGATAAGALLPRIGWRALFWLQIPICIFAGLVLLFALPGDFHAGKIGQDESVSPDVWKRLRSLDYLGAVLLTACLVLILYAMAAPTSIPVWPIIVSALVLVTFVNNEIYLAQDPIIPVALLKSRGLLLTCLGTVGFMMGRWSVLFYAPTYALAVRTWSPSSAGAMLIPTNFGFAVGGLSVGWLHIRRQGSFYAPTLVTYVLFPVTLAALGLMSTGSVPAWAFVLVLFACGFVTGAAMNYNLAHLLHITPKETHYVATALLATFRGFAGSFGSAIGGGVFSRSLRASLESRFNDAGLNNPRLIRQLLGSPALVGQLEGIERTIAVEGYQDALKVLWLIMAAIGMGTFFVQAGTGWNGCNERQQPKDDDRPSLLNDSDRRDTDDSA
ncbi:Putative major facilitator superfamily, MFS transporter superfamily [Septoria linicola]|uniref:Major facilitator superfamily, MFS transporter superfamily n=1 Tax=Septoria linicola TaxID=215465 RepID=A0A9Q9AIP7_9PEZI|nr:putative major facilitator superfamily, MFS transporter superfamily [Septoria linicola]USW47170.1 Putative major facilitator superfamily, MFS transporter superfamily [Septoria linicola]